jgi:tetratricopeptide (TPR) repeat protein
LNTVNNHANAGTSRSADKTTHGLVLFALAVFALAWPWEVYQRLPLPGMTLVKLTGLGIIFLALVARLRRSRVDSTAPAMNALRTGLELPILLFALACVQSLVHSLDMRASLFLFAQYVLYLVLFYAVIVLVRDRRDVSALAWCFVLSAAGVAVLSLFVAAGALYPTLVDATRHLAARLSEDMREGPSVRIAATALDFNQGVLPLLMALPLGLFLSLRLHRALRWIALPLVVILLAGIAVSFSRSTMAAAALVLLFAVLAGLRGRVSQKWLIGACALGVLALLVVGYAWWEPLSNRLLRGIGSYDPSYSSRWYVFEKAWEILPQYWLFGTGLNASDAAIAQVADPEAWRGITLHSVPFKLLLETGIFGLIAWIWLYGAMCWRVWRGYADAPLLRNAWLGVFLVTFLVQLVQPYMALSLYPFILGLALASVARRAGATSPALEDSGTPFEGGKDALHDSSEAKAGAKAPALQGRFAPILGALLLTSTIVVWNGIAYQRTAAETVALADALEQALQQERQGDWQAAGDVYQSVGESEIHRSRFYPVAADVAEFPVVMKDMHLPAETSPADAARTGLGRVAYARGDFESAASRFATVALPQAEALQAVALWQAGAFADAIPHFRSAMGAPPAPTTTPAETPLEQAENWLKLGELDRARALIAEVGETQEHAAEAQYLLGMAAESEKDRAAAKDHYRKAIAHLGTHARAQERLKAFE